jgi:amino acid permease
VLEAVTYIAIVVSWLLLLTLSREYLKAESPEVSYFQVLGILLLEAGKWIAQILAIVFSIGALAIYYLFYQSKSIPRWLSIWGLIGAVLYLVAPLLTMFGVVSEILMAPLALQEMVLAVWLIVKGFNLTENI